MYTIYATGDGRFTYEVFQSIALIFDTQTFIGLISVGFLLNVFILTIKAIQNQKLELQHLLVSFILYGVLFVPKADVEIADVQEGTVRTVSNVPLGVAAVGEILSTAGFVITDLFEQNFAPVSLNHGPYNGVLDDGFMEPLKILLALRDVPTEGDKYLVHMQENIKQYIAQCTSLALQVGYTTHAAIESADNAWEVMKYAVGLSSLNYIHPQTGVREVLTCAEATTEIDSEVNNSSSDFVKKIADKVVVQHNRPQATGLANIDSAINQFVGVGVESWKYILNASIYRVYGDGLSLAAAQKGDLAATIIVEEAKNRRNVSYAAESSIFQDIMRPMMSFIETLVYAISPLMAFLFVAGPMGISLGTKYLTLAAWVQLWLPLLAIVKLYIYLVVTGQIDEIAAAQVGTLSSIAAQYQYNDLMASYIGIASMLVAAVPAIALMLIYGGAVTATNLAGKLSSSGFVNSSVAAPATASASAGKAQAAGMTTSYDTASSQVVNARENLSNPEISGMQVSKALEGSIGSTIGQLKETAAKHTTAASQAFGNSDALRQAIKSGDSNTLTDKFVGSNAMKVAESFDDKMQLGAMDKMTETQKRSIAAQIQGAAALGVPGFKFGAGGKAEEEIANSGNAEQNASYANVIKYLNSQEGQAALSNELSQSTTSAKESDVTDLINQEDRKSFSDSLETSRKATENASRLASEKSTLAQSATYESPYLMRAAHRYAQEELAKQGYDKPVTDAMAANMFTNQVSKLIGDDSGGTTGTDKAADFIGKYSDVNNERAQSFMTSLRSIGDRLEAAKDLNSPLVKATSQTTPEQLHQDVAEQGQNQVNQNNDVNPSNVAARIEEERTSLDSNFSTMQGNTPQEKAKEEFGKLEQSSAERRQEWLAQAQERYDDYQAKLTRGEDIGTDAVKFLNDFAGDDKGTLDEATRTNIHSHKQASQAAVYATLMEDQIQNWRDNGGATGTEIGERDGTVFGQNSSKAGYVHSVGDEGTTDAVTNFDLSDFNENNPDEFKAWDGGYKDGEGLVGSLFKVKDEVVQDTSSLQLPTERLDEFQQIALNVQQAAMNGDDIGEAAERSLYEAGYDSKYGYSPEEIREKAQDIAQNTSSNYDLMSESRELAANRTALETMVRDSNYDMQGPYVGEAIDNPTNENIHNLFTGNGGFDRAEFGPDSGREGSDIPMENFNAVKQQIMDSPLVSAAGMNGENSATAMFAIERGIDPSNEAPAQGSYFERVSPEQAQEMYSGDGNMDYDTPGASQPQAATGFGGVPDIEPTSVVDGHRYHPSESTQDEQFTDNPAMASR